MKRAVLIEIAASLLILLFLYASVSKWLAFKLFIGEMNNQPLPNWMTPYLVWTIPTIEVLISLALMFGKTQLRGFYASLVLMSIFTIYSIAVLFHAFDYIPCSCGGVIRKLTWPQHVVFNLFFVGVSIAGIYWKKKKSSNISTIKTVTT